jgi:hypothetical protein
MPTSESAGPFGGDVDSVVVALRVGPRAAFELTAVGHGACLVRYGAPYVKLDVVNPAYPQPIASLGHDDWSTDLGMCRLSGRTVVTPVRRIIGIDPATLAGGHGRSVDGAHTRSSAVMSRGPTSESRSSRPRTGRSSPRFPESSWGLRTSRTRSPKRKRAK